ncbi:coA transferase [Jeotgalibacillus alimentarius]|uniref:CoA transferase n=1 Tax=Jeotgalibacillus alimentarius TaxID=135826 RepID=A0A0C2VCL1_9BACL|nr:CoA-transferase [Jeotgalibacillus alimentarius]KIL46677.1 coA transferase [Jeotgalibacillus alimentarius]
MKNKKKMDLKEAVDQYIKDGSLLAFSGNVLHRAPMGFIREIVRQGKKNLEVVKTAAAMDVDLLCAFGLVKTVHAGFVSYETKYGLATHYRRGVESGIIQGNEHACYTVICALRGATMNVPFMPVHGLQYGGLLHENDYFMVVENPFEQETAEPVTLVKTLKPHVAVIHVQVCDEEGNAIIEGAKYEDALISRAADKVIITAERVVPAGQLKFQKDKIVIPGFLTEAVVEMPKGAAPCSCEGKYDVNHRDIKAFTEADSTDQLKKWVASYEKQDHGRSYTDRQRGVKS